MGCGGPADKLVIVETNQELVKLLKTEKIDYFLGYGTNSLISDDGLRGTVVIIKGGSIEIADDLLTVSAGIWWDDVVARAVDSGLWGMELMSGIPSSVGGAIVGNIAAYGQAISDTLVNVDVFEKVSGEFLTLKSDDLALSYRYSDFQKPEFSKYIIIKATFKLNKISQRKLAYESALKIATQLQLDPNKLLDCRKIVLETRSRAGSLYESAGIGVQARSAGSFFRNPMVDSELAEQIMNFEEHDVGIEQIKRQNTIHGGVETRVSAAHVLLAAGFNRGQTWDRVRLHPDHVLKIENMGNASAKEIYDVANKIIDAVWQKFGIKLEPEVRFFGNF